MSKYYIETIISKDGDMNVKKYSMSKDVTWLTTMKFAIVIRSGDYVFRSQGAKIEVKIGNSTNSIMGSGITYVEKKPDSLTINDIDRLDEWLDKVDKLVNITQLVVE